MVDEAKYKKWFMLDVLLVFGMWLFLVISESFVVYSVLHDIIAGGESVLTENPYLLGVYGFFLLLMFVVEGLGCLNVQKSIKAHMYELTYYD